MWDDLAVKSGSKVNHRRLVTGQKMWDLQKNSKWKSRYHKILSAVSFSRCVRQI